MPPINFTNIPQPILITGATGFIGSHLIARLIQEDLKIIAFVLPNDPVPNSWNNKVNVFRGDITDQSAVEEIMKKAKIVIHLAAVVGDWGAPSLFQCVTIDGTKYVLQAAVKNNVLVVLTSSITVYGTALQNQICHEEIKLGKANGLYSWAKQEQEKMTTHLIKTQQLQSVIIRPANVYGPASQPWVVELIAAMKKGPSILGTGQQNAGLIYIDNLVELILLASSNEKAIGQIYNAAEDSKVTWRQYMTDLASLANIPAPKSIPKPIAKILASMMETVWKLFKIKSRPQITKEAYNLVSADLHIPINKARKELGYEPIVTYKQGMEKVKAYLSNHRII